MVPGMGSNPGGVAIPATRIIPLRGTGKRGYTAPGDAPIVALVSVDADDYDDLAQFSWHLTDTGYAARWYGPRGARKRERMHRRIMGLAPGDKRQVDHISRDKLDNRRMNLRVVTGDAENRQNVPGRGGTSRHRGVSFDRSRGKWQAQAKCGGRKFSKRFDTEQEAADAVRAWRAEHMPFSTD